MKTIVLMIATLSFAAVTSCTQCYDCTCPSKDNDGNVWDTSTHQACDKKQVALLENDADCKCVKK